MDERIVHIITAKDFGALSETEKEWVLETMTAADYDRLHKALQLAPRLDETVAPSPRLRASLMEQFEKPVSLPQTPQLAWYLHRVPVWQAAAVLLPAAVMILAFSRTDRKPDPVVQTIQTTDTVYVEKVVWKERVVVKTVKIKVPGEMADLPDTTGNTTLPEPVAGTSVAAQPELLQFFTSAKK